MNDLEYRIKTSADLKAMEEARKGLLEQKKVLQEMGKPTAELDAHLQKLDATLGSMAAKSVGAAEGINKAIEKLRSAGVNTDALVKQRNDLLTSAGAKAPGKVTEAFHAYKESGGGLEGIKEAAGVFGKGALAGAAAGVAALETARHALDEYAKQEDELFKRNQALKQRSQLTGEYTKKLDEMAEAAQSATGIDSDAWTGALTAVIQAGASPQNIERTTEMIKNVAGLPQYFGNVQASAEAVGKAINGNFEAFTRLGFVIDENASPTDKLNSLQEQLATRGGGQLEERNKTLHGGFTTLKNSTNDFYKALGKGIAESGAVQAVLGYLSTAISFYAKVISDATGKTNNLKTSIGQVGEELESVEQIADRYQKKLDKIKTSTDEAAKKREEFTKNRSKEDQEAIEQKTDEAAFNSAKVDLAEKGGFITHEVAEEKRKRIKAGLEDFKRSTDLKASDSEILSRKIAMDENNANVSATTDKAQEARKAATEAFRLKTGEDKLAADFDAKIEAKQAEVEKRFSESQSALSGLTAGAAGYERRKNEAVEKDPEIQKLNNERFVALQEYRNNSDARMKQLFGEGTVADEKGNVFDSNTLHRKADEASGIAKAMADAALKDNETMAVEKADAEHERTRKARHFQSEIATQTVQEVAGRIPEGGQPASGVDQRVVAQVLSPLTGGQQQRDLMMTDVLNTVHEQVSASTNDRRVLALHAQLLRDIQSEMQRGKRDTDILRTQFQRSQ